MVHSNLLYPASPQEVGDHSAFVLLSLDAIIYLKQANKSPDLSVGAKISLD